MLEYDRRRSVNLASLTSEAALTAVTLPPVRAPSPSPPATGVVRGRFLPFVPFAVAEEARDPAEGAEGVRSPTSRMLDGGWLSTAF